MAIRCDGVFHRYISMDQQGPEKSLFIRPLKKYQCLQIEVEESQDRLKYNVAQIMKIRIWQSELM